MNLYLGMALLVIIGFQAVQILMLGVIADRISRLATDGEKR